MARGEISEAAAAATTLAEKARLVIDMIERRRDFPQD
jgi:hypothetical protein